MTTPSLLALVLVLVSCGTGGNGSGPPGAARDDAAADPAAGTGGSSSEAGGRSSANGTVADRSSADGAAGDGPRFAANDGVTAAGPEARTGGWRLAGEDSPYLRQHADNPVDWYPWGEEAFEVAAERDVPIFLSIGYSSCHWCHVMEHESFEDEETAALMNERYVCVKVDREQRPDVDRRYMDAVQSMTGSGGWPLSVWLTPDGRPFYGGTYFPPRGRGRMPGFREVLTDLADAWATDRERILDIVERNEALLLDERLPEPGEWDLEGILTHAVEQLSLGLDPELGGMRGSQPQRFPPSGVLTFLMRSHRRGHGVDLARVHTTLDAMAGGGMRDHVGGGFHRYSVDPRWEVPHFEKMLYDNALLAKTYAEAWALTGADRHARVALDTLRWLVEDMRSPRGLYYAARDADSLPFDGGGDPVDGARPEEGLVYTWTPVELVAVLGEEDGRAFARLFHVTASGNFEGGRSIVRPMRTDAEMAADPGPDVPSGEAFLDWYESARTRLLAARDRRPQAFRDEKCLAAWNGLALSGFARTGRLLGDAGTVARAADLARAVREHLLHRRDGVLTPYHQLFEGRATGVGELTEHAYLARGFLDAYEATGDAEWLAVAWELAHALLDRFEDEDGGFYETRGADPLLPTRGRELFDGARPSGQSVALQVLVRLMPLDDTGRLEESVERALARLGRIAERQPRAVPALLVAIDAWVGPLAEVVLDGPDGGTARDAHDALVEEAQRTYLPAALLVADASEAASALEGLTAEEPSLLAGRRSEDQPRAWVCKQGVCLLPVSAPDELAGQWDAVVLR